LTADFPNQSIVILSVDGQTAEHQVEPHAAAVWVNGMRFPEAISLRSKLPACSSTAKMTNDAEYGRQVT
jgi:hypothetical protein